MAQIIEQRRAWVSCNRKFIVGIPIAVSVLLLEFQQHIGQFLYCLGRFQIQAFQPVPVDIRHVSVHLGSHGKALGQTVNLSLPVCTDCPEHRVRFHGFRQVRHIPYFVCQIHKILPVHGNVAGSQGNGT